MQGDLPAPARPGTSASPRRAALVPYLRDLGVSHLYLSPCLQARRGSTHGYDVIDPRRISEDARRRGRRSARSRAPGSSVTARHRPQPHGRRRREPLLGRPGRCASASSTSTRARAATGASSTSTSWRACARRTPRCSRPTHALVLALVAEGVVDGLRIDHPDGLADPAGYLRRLAERGVERIWVEKILEPGEELPDWPVEGTTGYEFMADAAGLFVDPAGEEPLTGALRGAHGRAPRVRRAGGRGQARGGAHDLPARGRSPAGADRRARHGRRRGGAAGVPHLRRARGRGRRRPGPAHRGGGRSSRARARRPRRPRGRRGGGVRRALPADDRRDHGQGGRGHRALPLLAPGRAQRGRLRSGALGPRPRGDARGQPRARTGASRAACSPPRRTTPSARATSARASGPWRASPPSGGRGCGRGAR